MDRVTAEMLKAEKQMTPKLLATIFNNIWQDEQAPDEWNHDLIVKLKKKGDLGNCDNWRGITLLSLTSKIFSRIILKRLQDALEKDLRQEQAGFRKGKSCIDQIFVLRQILEQSDSSLYVNFIDYQKAFDSIYRESLWKIMRHYGIPPKIVQIIKMLYNEFDCSVVCGNTLTDPFNIRTGVKQGCILPPFSSSWPWTG